MSKNSNNPVKTFSIGLENERRSELPFARAVADRYNTDHHELLAKPDACSLIERIIWHFDEPFGDSSSIPTFLVSHLSRKYVTVAISGDGGDELFGGYKRYQRILRRAQLENLPKILRTPVSRYIGNLLPFGFRGKAFLQSLQYDSFYAFSVGTTEELKGQLLSTEFLERVGNLTSFEVAKKFIKNGRALIDECMLFDLNIYLPDDILTKVDRMSMANSLETRAPFLDHNLVEYVMRIPHDLKIRNGTSKYILRKLIKDFLPIEIFQHEKTGFSIPIDEWFRNELRELLFDTLGAGRVDASGTISSGFVQKLMTQHMSGQRNHAQLLWQILMFQLWYEHWAAGKHENIKRALIYRGVR